MKMVGRRLAVRLTPTGTATGEYLDGANSYRLHIPADVPAKDFWSIVVYDPQTRSELQTGQPFPSKNSTKRPVAPNADGSVDLYFGPSAPGGHRNQLDPNRPRQGLVRALRLYGPLEPWFDQTWRPGEIELVR